jgi:hypothetical protein
MTPSLSDYKPLVKERLLDLLWRQWTTLGVTGHATLWRRTLIDPEALLLVSCTLARHDPRLFDALLDWLAVNGRYVHVQRVRRLATDLPFAGEPVFAAMAAETLSTASATKWARSAKPRATATGEQPLFFLPNGLPLPVLHTPDPIFAAHGFARDQYEDRHTAQSFQTRCNATLILKLRALVGVSARCELLAYLLLNPHGSPRAMARACGYYPATVIKALSEMMDSGFLCSRIEGRQRHYSLDSRTWGTLLLDSASPPWIAWPSLFSALEQLWLFLAAPERDGQSPLAQASALRRLLTASVNGNLARSGLNIPVFQSEAYTGETLLPHFMERLGLWLDAVDRLG